MQVLLANSRTELCAEALAWQVLRLGYVVFLLLIKVALSRRTLLLLNVVQLDN